MTFSVELAIFREKYALMEVTWNSVSHILACDSEFWQVLNVETDGAKSYSVNFNAFSLICEDFRTLINMY